METLGCMYVRVYVNSSNPEKDRQEHTELFQPFQFSWAPYYTYDTYIYYTHVYRYSQLGSILCLLDHSIPLTTSYS